MQFQYGSYSTTLSCFQSIESITARPNLYGLERMRHKPLTDKFGTLGEDGYALFLREEFKPDTIILAAVGASVIPTVILLAFTNHAIHDLGFNKHSQKLFVFNYVIFTSDLLALLALHVKGIVPREIKWMASLLALTLALTIHQHMRFPQTAALSVFLPCFSTSISLLLLRMIAPDWTYPRIALAWKGIRFSFLHWNKGTKDAHHPGQEEVDFDR